MGWRVRGPGSLSATPTRTDPTSTPSLRPGPGSSHTPAESGSVTCYAPAQRPAQRRDRLRHARLGCCRRPARGRACRRRGRRSPGRTPAPACPPRGPRSRAAAVVATTKLTFRPSAENSATTPGRAPSRLRTSDASARRSLPPTPSGAATATSAMPPTSSACVGERARRRQQLGAAQLLELLLRRAQPLHGLPDALRQLLRGHLELLGELADQHVLARQEPERVQPDQRLDAAHARADRRLGEQLHHADLAGAVHVRAAAQLPRVVADRRPRGPCRRTSRRRARSRRTRAPRPAW